MKLSFWGAARVVTGSCHRLTACSKNILIDCGLQQGGDVYNENELFFDATAIDAVCVTHAHTDHSGRLPLMVKNGYKGAYLRDTGNLRPLKDHAAGQRPDTGKRCPVESKEK